jgi:hypothetical protein
VLRGEETHKCLVLPGQAHAAVRKYLFVKVPKLAFERVKVLDADTALEAGPLHADEVV